MVRRQAERRKLSVTVLADVENAASFDIGRGGQGRRRTCGRSHVAIVGLREDGSGELVWLREITVGVPAMVVRTGVIVFGMARTRRP